MSVEMQQLRHFCAVSEFRHFGRAAEELAMSQPALSRSIQNLEDRLRVQLFDRSRAGVSLTPCGEIFLHRARSVLSEVGRAVQEMDSMTGRVVGSSTFGLTPSFDHFIVPNVVAGLVRESAHIHLSIKTGFYEDLLVMVRTGELDFALAMMPEVHGHPEVFEDVVLNAHFQVYGRPEHPLMGRTGLTLMDVAEQGWIVPDQPALRLFERWFESSAAHRPRYVIRTASMQLLKETMQHCDLLSVLPDHLVKDEVASGRLLPLKMLMLPKMLSVAVIYRRSTSLPLVARKLVEGIKAACAAHTSAVTPSRSATLRRASGERPRGRG